MKRSSLRALLVAGALCPLAAAHAAPLDALLSANRDGAAGSGSLEAGYDVVNDTVDIFGIRDKDADFSGTNIGDYRGAHLRLGAAVTPRLWIDGGLWRRRIDYRSDQAELQTWQIAAQYKLVDALGHLPSVSARLGAWGNSADTLEKTSATQFQGATLDSVRVTDPKDRQYQLDLIASWPASEGLEITTFAGAGTSRVSIGSISGTTTRNGCKYDVAFTRSEVSGTLSQPCSANVVIQRFTVPNDAYGVDVYRETEYDARYLHGGVSGRWTGGAWQLRAGYQYQVLQRRGIDELIESRGGVANRSNHILLGEVAYRLTPSVSLFVRGQYMAKQFTGEIPLAYNTFTARRFDKHYGFASAGLVVGF